MFSLKQIPRKNDGNMSIFSDVAKKLLTSNRKSHTMAMFLAFSGVSSSNPVQIRPLSTEISKKVLPESTGFSM